MDDILQAAFNDLPNCGAKFQTWSTSMTSPWPVTTHAVQNAVHSLVIEVSRYGMHFRPSECKVLVHDRQGPVPAFILGDVALDMIDGFIYIGSCITAG